MYLSTLSTNEKRLFLTLAFEVLKADGQISSSEARLIMSYAAQLGVPFDKEDLNTDIDGVISELQSSSARVKRIILLELLRLSLSDDEAENNELALIGELSKVFGFDDQVLKEASDVALTLVKAAQSQEKFIAG